MKNSTSTKATTGPLRSCDWQANNNQLTWELITEMEKKENRQVFWGKQTKGENTKGETRAKVQARIAQVIIPDIHSANPKRAADRVNTKVDWLFKGFKKHAKRLGKKTGEGLKDGEGENAGEGEEGEGEGEYHYIPASGPDSTTPAAAVNLWQLVCRDFPFFARLWANAGTRPNMVPIVVTTGIGPSGPNAVWMQPRNPVETTTGPRSSPTPENPIDHPVDVPASPGPPPSPPPTQPQSTPVPEPALNRAPRVSTMTQAAMEKLKTVKTVPQKRSIADALAEITDRTVNILAEKVHNKNINQRRQLLLDEFKAGLLTKDEYREQLDELLNRVPPRGNPASRSPSPRRLRRSVTPAPGPSTSAPPTQPLRTPTVARQSPAPHDPWGDDEDTSALL